MSLVRSRLLYVDRAEAVSVLPAVGLVAVWIALMPGGGGFAARDWLPAGLAMLGLLGVAAVGARSFLPAGRAPRIALGAFAAFTALAFASIAWSPAPADAWEASNLLLTTLLTGWILALVPWRAATAFLVLAAYGAGAAVVCAVTLLQATGATDLSLRFLDGRWNQPLDYPNTAAAFALMAAVPMLVAAARPDLPVVVKSLAQAAATFLAAFGLLPQSRGAVIGVAALVVVLLALGPNRWRLALHLAALAATVALVAAGPVLEVYTVAIEQPDRTSAALADASTALFLAAAVGGLAGIALGLAQERLRLGDRGRRAARAGGVAAWVVAGLALAAVAAVNAEGIGTTLEDQWRSLKNPGVRYGQATSGTNRLTDTDPLQRYDYWRVSVDAFLDRPVAGIGAAQFGHRYTAERRYSKVSKYPHNLTMRAIAESGVLGTALLVLCGGVLAAGIARRRRSATPADLAVVTAAAGVTAYFLVHAQFDWLEPYPVLAWPAFGLPLMALVALERSARLARLTDGLGTRGGTSAPPARTRRRRALGGAALAGGGAAGLAAAASLLLPYLSVRYEDRAVAAARTAPATAVADFERAAELNPLDPGPLVLEGVMTLTAGDPRTARSAFERALEREPSYLPHVGLAVIARQAGDRRAAERHIAAAIALDPFDPTIPDAARRIRRDGPVDPAAVMRDVLTSPFFADERLA